MAQQEKHLRFAVLAVDVGIFTVYDNDLKVLLISTDNPSFKNLQALPGGLIKTNETSDDAAYRHLKTKGGIKKAFIEQLYTFSELKRDPRGRVVSVAYYGLIPSTESGTPFLDNDDAQWVSVKDIKKLAYDHNDILAIAIDRIQTKLTYTNLAYNLVPKEFTLSELQSVYESVLGSTIDKRNFRKKLLALNIVKGTGKEKRGGANRPAELFTFTKRTPQVVTVL